MAEKLGFLDAIRDFINKTNIVGRPKNEEDLELFNKMINKETIAINEPLSVIALKELCGDMKSEEAKSCITFYLEVAKSLGVRCIRPDDISVEMDISGDEVEVEDIDKLKNMDEEVNSQNDTQQDEYDNDKQNKFTVELADNTIEKLNELIKNSLGKALNDEVIENIKRIIRDFIDVNKTDRAVIELGENTINTLTNKITDIILEALILKESDKSVSEIKLNKIEVELSDDTLNNLATKIKEALGFEDIEVSDYKWHTESTINEDFDKAIFGYTLKDCIEKLELKKALLLVGVPGTGKTRILKHLLHKLAEGDIRRYKIISFSQNTDYTDFIGGLVCINGRWTYKDGILVEMCKAADKDRDHKYYLGIDEISRGNTEAIFGELMTGIEHRDTLITLKNGRTLVVPSNLYIVGTMNILDNSTKKLDMATLERFTQYRIEPQWSIGYIDWLCDRYNASSEVKEILAKVSNIMIKINNMIKQDKILGSDKLIGTRAISGIKLTMENVKIAIENQLIPDIEKRVITYGGSDEILELVEEIKGLLKNAG